MMASGGVDVGTVTFWFTTSLALWAGGFLLGFKIRMIYRALEAA